MKKGQLLPNVITAFALTCGLFVIFKTNMIPPGQIDLHVLTLTAGLMLLAALADVLDGAVARAMHAESDFGVYFDSMSDAITFGVAPSVVVLKTFSMEPGTIFSYMLTFAAMVYSVCGVLRLVRFNLSTQLAKVDQNLAASDKKNFTGLPIPAAAAAVISMNLFLLSEEFDWMFAIPLETRMWILFATLITLGYFMVSRWKFPSIKTFQIRVGSFQVVFLTVMAAVVIFYGIFHHFAVVFFCLTWLYILLAWILSFIRLISGKRSKTLEDFEPEPDDLDE
jgi:CDP-diacylglycerol--serine O-phosphatidyltransferase